MMSKVGYYNRFTKDGVHGIHHLETHWGRINTCEVVAGYKGQWRITCDSLGQQPVLREALQLASIR